MLDLTEVLANLEGDDDELPILDDDTGEIGGKVKISLGDMDLPSWERDLKGDLELIDTLLASMNKITWVYTPASSSRCATSTPASTSTSTTGCTPTTWSTSTGPDMWCTTTPR